MIGLLADPTDITPGEPPHEFVLADIDIQYTIQSAAWLERAIERLSLRQCARKPVEHETPALVRCRDPRHHQPNCHIVRHQRALVHVRLGKQAQLGFVTQILAEQVARRRARNAQFIGDSRRLRAFACARRPQQYDFHSCSYPCAFDLLSLMSDC